MKFKLLRDTILACNSSGERSSSVPVAKLAKLMASRDKLSISRKELIKQLADLLACEQHFNDKMWAENPKTIGLMARLERVQNENKEMFETNAALLAVGRVVTTLAEPQPTDAYTEGRDTSAEYVPARSSDWPLSK
jgi:hypothetical protein